MQTIILGSGSPLPHPDRAGPATLVRAGGKDFLFDCGRAVLMRAMSVGAAAPSLAGVFITHLHSDHVTDFNDVVTTRWVMSPGPNPLPVYGPVGTSRFADDTIRMLGQDIGYRTAHHDDLNEGPELMVSEHAEGLVLEEDGIRITCAPTDHSPVHPTLGYRIEAEGQVVAIAGDTVPCEGLASICQGADVYVQTVIRSEIIEKAPMKRMRDVQDYHSDVQQAARTAEENGVKTLILNHLVPPPKPDQEPEIAAQAKAHFSGEVIVARDLTMIS